MFSTLLLGTGFFTMYRLVERLYHILDLSLRSLVESLYQSTSATAPDGGHLQRHQLKRFFFKDPSTFEETPLIVTRPVEHRFKHHSGRSRESAAVCIQCTHLLKLSLWFSFDLIRYSSIAWLGSTGTRWILMKPSGFYSGFQLKPIGFLCKF